jgi:hypothetical protein
MAAKDPQGGRALESLARTAEFWARAVTIYAGYKACQAHALALRALGWSEERLREEHWARQHTKAAQQLYSLCVDLRGFYLKVGGRRRREGGRWWQQQQLRGTGDTSAGWQPASRQERGASAAVGLQIGRLAGCHSISRPAGMQVGQHTRLPRVKAWPPATQTAGCAAPNLPPRRHCRRRRGSSSAPAATLCRNPSAASCRCCTTRWGPLQQFAA